MPRLTPTTRRSLIQVLPFGVIWSAFSLIFLITDAAAVGDVAVPPDDAIRRDPALFLFASLAINGCTRLSLPDSCDGARSPLCYTLTW